MLKIIELEISKLSTQAIHLKQDLIMEVLFLMVVLWIAGKIFRRLNMPAVIGELIAGIILGPPVLGLVSLSGSFDVLIGLGSFFLMFFAGLETDFIVLKKNAKKSFSIAFFGVLVPFIFGTYIAFKFFGNLSYALFIALTMSVTAIAVTDRLITDIKFPKVKDKTVLIGAAVMTDMIILVLFSAILSFISLKHIDAISLLVQFFNIVFFLGVVNYVGIVLYPKIAPKLLTPKADGFTFAILMAFVIGAFGELLGLHFVLGAFIAGLFVHEELAGMVAYRKTTDRMYAISHGFLGPVFFFSIASYFSFTALSGIYKIVVIIILVAFVFKVIGAAIGAMITGSDMKHSVMFGVGMNGRATIAMIIGSIGLKEGIINQQMFSLIIAIAIITTIMTPIFLNTIIKSINK